MAEEPETAEDLLMKRLLVNMETTVMIFKGNLKENLGL